MRWSYSTRREISPYTYARCFTLRPTSPIEAASADVDAIARYSCLERLAPSTNIRIVMLFGFGTEQIKQDHTSEP